MSVLNPIRSGSFVQFDRSECVAVGKSLKDDYADAKPFPHIVIDDFLPTEALRRVVEEFPERQSGRFADAQSNLKTGYQLEMIGSQYTTSFFHAFNSFQFLRFLEELTGIDDLLSDPEYAGGGLHETARGGHLSIHADFNMHPRYKLLRRLNLILFLNEEWSDEYGGHLELWNPDMKSCAKKIAPVMGRAVIFNTDQASYHGHPDPLTCPESRYRRSMALYYYTIPSEPSVLRTTTNFQVRPGSTDTRNRKDRIRELARGLCPPLLLSLFRRK